MPRSRTRAAHDHAHPSHLPHPAPAIEGQSHSHEHPHQQREKVILRLKRAEGHLTGVRKMVESGADCSKILIQIAAVRAALDATAKVVLADHVESCLHDARLNGDTDAAWADLRAALESFIR